MSYFISNARSKTAALCAAAFLILSCLIGFVTQFMGIAGAILSEAMILGSPFCWLNGPVKYVLRLNQGLLYPLALAPYALLGWSIGYYRPFRGAGVGKMIRAVLFRFAMIWIPLVAIGVRRVFSN